MILGKIKFQCTIFTLVVTAAFGQWRPDPEGHVDFTSSHLPIIIINADQRIVDSPRITAAMKVIDNDDGTRNSIADARYTYDGRIAIELRGRSSSQYPKKQYRLETQDDSGENLNVSLLGLPAENDWILYGPYEDESLIRNALAYKWSNDIGRYAPRTRFCELMLNDDYRGIYLLVEKIKRDNNRVDIARLDADDVSGDSLTGGYIIKIDQESGENNDGWRSERGVDYLYDYPKPDEIVRQQKEYIKKYMNGLEAAMSADWSVDASFLDRIDLSSFVDHFLLNELCKNVDAYRISSFMYKDRDDNNSRLIMGPIWDFNLSMAKAWFPEDAGVYIGWQVDYRLLRPSDGAQPPLWWEKLAHHAIFENTAQARWNQLRATTFRQDNLFADIDNFVLLLGDAKERNFTKWPSMLQNGETYEAKIAELKQWLTNRLAWLDANIRILATVDHSAAIDLKLEQNSPNPFNPKTTISFSLPTATAVELAVYNATGQKVATLARGTYAAGTHQVIWDAAHLPSGLYFYSLKTDAQIITKNMILLK
ncbi:CotH kinase family protein [candidate division KSB1 bacterium]|nr:CotH kinase family protein [candidate division KSB1 bacterium]